MSFRIVQERCGDALTTFKLAGRLADDAVDVLIGASAEMTTGAVVDLSEVSYADDAGVTALEALRGRGVVLQGSRLYLALLLQEDLRGHRG
jgi:anti-anti-sigma regulatory factor